MKKTLILLILIMITGCKSSDTTNNKSNNFVENDTNLTILFDELEELDVFDNPDKTYFSKEKWSLTFNSNKENRELILTLDYLKVSPTEILTIKDNNGEFTTSNSINGTSSTMLRNKSQASLCVTNGNPCTESENETALFNQEISSTLLKRALDELSIINDDFNYYNEVDISKYTYIPKTVWKIDTEASSESNANSRSITNSYNFSIDEISKYFEVEVIYNEDYNSIWINAYNYGSTDQIYRINAINSLGNNIFSFSINNVGTCVQYEANSDDSLFCYADSIDNSYIKSNDNIKNKAKEYLNELHNLSSNVEHRILDSFAIENLID